MFQLRWEEKTIAITADIGRIDRTLQYRWIVNPVSEWELHGFVWSEWIDVPVVREGVANAEGRMMEPASDQARHG
jgi:hypothetical protein